jgi:hypothetical protein
VVQKIMLPSQVKHDTEFDITVVLENVSVGSQVAGEANVNIRAGLQLPTQSTNVAIAAINFRELRPGQPQSRTVRARAPFKAGVWQVRATVTPVDYADDANNDREAVLVVVN